MKKINEIITGIKELNDDGLNQVLAYTQREWMRRIRKREMAIDKKMRAIL